MNVLVTGSSGLIGSKIAETVSKHRTCLGVDLVPGKFTTHLASITDKRAMHRIVSGVDAIIHAAALLTPYFVLDRFPIQQDGVRTEDDATAGFVDEWLARDYRALGYAVVRVPVMSPEGRLAFVLERLSEQNRQHPAHRM